MTRRPDIPALADHSRRWRNGRHVYPVISRRAGGLSLGVNLNPDKACNFDCVYCEVDRTTPGPRSDIDLDQLEREMAILLDLTASGTLFAFPPFDSAGPAQRYGVWSPAAWKVPTVGVGHHAVTAIVMLGATGSWTCTTS